MKFEEILEEINNKWKKSGLDTVPKTPIVSPLYPGNFCYCLDEVEIYNKYGNFIDIGEEHYQKLQPTIRIADFETMVGKSKQHLGQFNIATINGFNSVPKHLGEKQYENSVLNMFDFMTSLGLDLSKFRISYFSGNDAKSIELSRKSDEKKRKIRFDKFIEEDNLKDILLEAGFKKNQLIPNNTRDNYLTSAWYITEAPWGYRNEILYQLPDGNLLDIGTIERLVVAPIIEREFFKDRKGYESIATGLNDWNMNIVVDAIGIERTIQAIEGKTNIFDIEPYELYKTLNFSSKIIEAGKIVHRVFSDVSFDNLSGSKNHKKYLIKKIMRNLNELNTSDLENLFKINAKVYSSLHPEYYNSIDKSIYEIESYRRRCKK